MSSRSPLRLFDANEAKEMAMEDVEVVIGADAHKRTHTFVAADERGREVSSKTVAATSEGHMVVLAWAASWPQRRWAIEDCRHLTRTLESDLLRAGETVARVPALSGGGQAQRENAGQVRSDRCACGSPCGLARARAADRAVGWTGARAAPPRRSPRGPRPRENTASGPDSLASARDLPRARGSSSGTSQRVCGGSR